MKFYIVDAFSDAAFGGNPAGAVFLDPGTDFPEDELMRRTAAELRYSETAFVRKLNENEFNIRYFTPAAEVDLCGHATIGVFTILLSEGLIKPGKTYINHTLAGDLEIKTREDMVMMDMALPETLGTIDGPEALNELHSVMGIPKEEVIVKKNSGKSISLMPMIISTGLPDIIMPVISLNALEKISPDFPALSDLSKKYEVTGVHAFSFDDKEPDITAHCRNFAPLYDIDEESATGTSSGALAYYLLQNDLIEDDSDALFIQGETMGRPSRILSHIKKESTGTKIQIGGTGTILARGEIFI